MAHPQNTPTNVVAIDPGKSGGIAWHDGTKMDCCPMPQTPADVVALLQKLRLTCDTLVIEELPRFVPMGGGKGIPGSMAAVMFENFGIIIGASLAMKYKLVRIHPKVWQKTIGFGPGNKNANGKAEWKNRLKGRASELFPGVNVTLKTSDALLIWEAYRATI